MVLTRSAGEIAEAFQAEGSLTLQPRYNLAPSQNVVAVRADAEARRRLCLLRWGLVPGWARDASIGNRLINARSETAAEKPSFRSALRRRRCLVAADGFYEWAPPARGRRGPKQPYLFRSRDGSLLAIAGLWEQWRDPEGPLLETCTLLTTEANAAVREVHDRMPVLLDPDDFGAWLDPNVTDLAELLPLLVPPPVDRLESFAVGLHVNDPRHDDPACIDPLA
jgi:putative SOS response-associated peptidase YedK